MSADKRFKVAICGGGIAGLTMAVALSRFPDIEVEVFEGAACIAEIGAGIGFFPRPWEILKKLGLEEELLKRSDVKPVNGPAKSFHYRKSDQEKGFDFYTLITQGILIPLHRAEFQKVLLNNVSPACKIHCAKRLRTYVREPCRIIKLLFEDGTAATCDVLIGADGIKSAVRRALLTEKAQIARGRNEDAAVVDEILAAVEPVWAGQISYRTVIPAEKLKARAPGHRVLTDRVKYIGKDAVIIAYPVSLGKLVNVAVFKAWHDLEGAPFEGQWVSTADKAEFVCEFSSWETEVQELLDCVEKPMRWAVHTVRPIDSFVQSRVVLAGDAAHAMLPYQGSGAGQAVEDAYILSSLLGHPKTTLETLDHALQVYDQVRRPFSLEVYRKSRLAGQYMMLHPDVIDLTEDKDGVVDGEQTRGKLLNLAEELTKNWEWSWTTRIDGEFEGALKLLEEKTLTCNGFMHLNGAVKE
ncbi:hypothetical protein AX17_007211 [Amanita inopinata Kibby_2008]|nr:hypothetical protein AX17_007211 [Amanita inopinata Kibby_2008]